MKKYKALENLPFNIKKGDILTENMNIVTNEKGDIIPINPAKEKSFFKEIKILNPSFEKDTLVFIKKKQILS
jgi:hypothetical protein